MKRWLSNLLIIVFSLTFLISAYFLLDYFLDSRKQKNEFDQLAQIMNAATVPPEEVLPPVQENADVPQTTDPTQPETPEESELVQITDPETGETVEVLPEFAELYTMNNHLVGWISIEDTAINYPVMQNTATTDYYLNRGFDRAYSRHGCIYVSEACDVFAPSDNLTIYGHRMGDGTMFNDLHKYADQDFYVEHPTITFNTLTEHHVYEILSIFRISSTVGHPFQYHLFVDAEDEADFDEYVANCKSYALYDTGVTAEYGDKLITLSTCEYTRTNGRLVVVAKQLI